jgi:hypothetical protein
MGLRIPLNQSVTSKYTAGKEYIIESTYKEYKGYYYELNGKLFAGKEFNVNAPVLVKLEKDKLNPLLLNPSTFVYGKISGINLNNQEPPPYYFNSDTTDNTLRYFISKNAIKPLSIKEINKDTFEQFKDNVLYTSVSIYYQGGFTEDNLNKAEQTLPGIKAYLSSNYVPGIND